MSKIQPSLAAVLIALVIAFPAEAAKKKKSAKAKKAKVTETIPADLPPVDDESLPGNESAAAASEPVPMEPPGELPPPESEEVALQESTAPLDEDAPAMPATPSPDTRVPAQMGPSQGSSMTADTPPPPGDELTPGEAGETPDQPPPVAEAGEPQAPDEPPPVADTAPESAPPDEPPSDLPPPEAPAIRAAAPPKTPVAPVTTTENEPPGEPPMDEERLPPTDYEAVKKKRAAERRQREKALEEMADTRAAEEYPVLKPGRFKPRRLAEEDSSATISADGSREYTWQSPRHWGLDIQYAPVSYKALELGGAGAYANKLGAGARVNFEWMFLQEFGKLSLGLGLQYDNLPAASSLSGESLTVTVLGGEATLTYRLDLIEHQILVPFGRFGMNGAYATQNRPDGSVASQGGYRGMLYGGGVELCLFIFEKRTARLLDRNFGINETYVVFEYVKSSNSKSGVQPDLSHDEFRIGLRFEI